MLISLLESCWWRVLKMADLLLHISISAKAVGLSGFYAFTLVIVSTITFFQFS
jgi:hypothetical protein